MNKNYVNENNCPYCSHKTDSAVNEFDEDIKPSPGDITLCIICGEISEFDSEMQLIKFNISKLDKEQMYDIRLKQLTIAKIHFKETKLQ